jgi:hypothetical protein
MLVTEPIRKKMLLNIVAPGEHCFPRYDVEDIPFGDIAAELPLCRTLSTTHYLEEMSRLPKHAY